MKQISVILVIFFVTGCSAIFSDQQIENNCFPSFEQDAGQFFTSVKNDTAYIWSIGGIHDDGADTPFLVKNGINGFLMPENITMSMKPVNSSAKLHFTGRVFKKWPNWGGYYIGGSRKNIKLEVTVEGKNYLVFEMYIPGYLKSKLPSQCSFE